MTREAAPSDSPDNRFCPQCGGQLTQVGTFWICPTHGQIADSEPFAPLRIFLSYGHDPNEELVRRIKADLEQRGHDVWFDKTEIKAGDDWRRSITEGILHSQRVVSFLSKHSTRDPGVCRDEIAIAIGVKGGNIQTILVETEKEVQPPVNIGHIQWLDMRDWKERRTAGGPTWEHWYQSKLAEIVRVLESDESRRFAGEIETLHGHLKPIRSDARIYDLLRKGFFGRTWLFEAVEEWRLDGNRDSRLFWITGDPGVGKSAFAAKLAHIRSDSVIAAQFVEWDKPDHRDARRVVRSLAFQLATRLPDYRKLLLALPEIAELDRKEPTELFDYLLANPLRSVISGGRERQLIVVDALDEATENGRNPLVEMLARHTPRLPGWLGLVVTSRPESAVQTPLQGLNPFVLDTRTEANLSDLRDYLRRQLAPQLHDRPDASRLVQRILDKSEGVFLYVERLCDDVQQNHLSLDHPEQFPQGLGGIFRQWFGRLFPDLGQFRKDVRPGLRAILAAREPLPVTILQRLFQWQDEELHDFTRILGSLFPVTTDYGHEVIKPYHKSLADWIVHEENAGHYYVSISQGHGMLADYCWEEYQRSHAKTNRYALLHLPEHLQESNQWQRLCDILCSEPFVAARSPLDPTGIVTVRDYNGALEALPDGEWRRIWGAPIECVLFAMAGIRHWADFGEQSKCIKMLNRCSELVTARRSPELTSSWHSIAGRLSIEQAKFEEAERILLDGLRLARQAAFDEGLITFLAELTVLLRASGRSFASAEELLRQTLEIQTSASDMEWRVRTNLGLSTVLIRMGKLAMASAHLREARASLTGISSPVLTGAFKKCQGYLSLYRGEYQLASDQFTSACAEFESASNAQEARQCKELGEFARVTEAEKSPLCRVHAWRQQLLSLVKPAGLSAPTQTLVQRTLDLLDTLVHPVGPQRQDGQMLTRGGADTVAIGAAIDELARIIASPDGLAPGVPAEPQPRQGIRSAEDRSSELALAERKVEIGPVIEQVSRLVAYGKLEQARQLAHQLPDTPHEIAALKDRLMGQIKGAEAERDAVAVKSALERAKQLAAAGDFRAARERIQSLPNSPAELARLKQKLLSQFASAEAAKNVEDALVQAARFGVTGKLADARRVVQRLPDVPGELQELKGRLANRIEAAESTARVNSAIDEAKQMVEAGEFPAARERIQSLPNSPAEIARLKQELLSQFTAAEAAKPRTLGKQTAKEQGRSWWQFWR